MPAVCLLSDASEQGGVDWQLTHEIIIAGKDLIPLFDAVDELLLIRTNYFQDADANGDDLPDGAEDRIQELNKIILRSIQRHTLPPVALGYRRSNLPHKLQSQLHALRAELFSLSQLEAKASCVVSQTSDMGTERLTAESRTKNQSVGDLVNHFVDPPDFGGKNESVKCPKRLGWPKSILIPSCSHGRSPSWACCTYCTLAANK